VIFEYGFRLSMRFSAWLCVSSIPLQIAGNVARGGLFETLSPVSLGEHCRL